MKKETRFISQLIVATSLLASCSGEERVEKEGVERVQEVVAPKIEDIEKSKPWPIRVTSVSSNHGKEGRWVVETENGVLYYTNMKPRVGDVAFCLDDNDSIVPCR